MMFSNERYSYTCGQPYNKARDLTPCLKLIYIVCAAECLCNKFPFNTGLGHDQLYVL